jgi:hypothetical protein
VCAQGLPPEISLPEYRPPRGTTKTARMRSGARLAAMVLACAGSVHLVSCATQPVTRCAPCGIEQVPQHLEGHEEPDEETGPVQHEQLGTPGQCTEQQGDPGCEHGRGQDDHDRPEEPEER